MSLWIRWLGTAAFLCAQFAGAEPATGRRDQLQVAMVHWPPAKIIRAEIFSGIDVEILSELTKLTAVEFVYRECPWVRCLKMMQLGELDLITSIAKRPDRLEYLEFLEPPIRDGYDISFYTLGTEIKTYQDLDKQSIGVIRGSAYFEKFDSNHALRKIPLTKENQLIKMLVTGRLQVILGIGSNLDYMIHVQGLSRRVHKAQYSVASAAPSYIGMSKKSGQWKVLSRLKRALVDLKKNGRLRAIEEAFLSELYRPQQR